MEKPQLEKVIEQLEKLDLREWDKDCDDTLSVKIGGLRFYLKQKGSKNIFDGDMIRYELTIKNIDKNIGCIKYSYNKYEKTSRDKLEKLYKRVDSDLQEIQDTEIIERLNEFLS